MKSNYHPPSVDILIKARTTILHTPELKSSFAKDLENIIDPLLRPPILNTSPLIGYWIFIKTYLTESLKIFSADSKINSEKQRILNMLRFTESVLYIQPGNSLDQHSEFFYLMHFYFHTKTNTKLYQERELAIFYLARLLYQMDLIRPATQAIWQFSQIPALRAAKKQQAIDTETYSEKFARLVKKVTFNREEPRRIQIVFLQMVAALMSTLEKNKAPYYIEDLLKGFAFWIRFDIEKENDKHTSNSSLYKVLEEIFGYEHTHKLKEDVKKARIDQLIAFLTKIDDSAWIAAAEKINCDEDDFNLCKERYFRNYKALKEIQETIILPRSTKVAAGIVASRATWTVGSTAAACLVPTIATNVYHRFHLDAVADSVGTRMAKKVGDFVPRLRWIIEPPVKKVSTTVAETGIKSTVEGGINVGVNRYKGTPSEPTSKGKKKIKKIPRLNFKGFLQLAMAGAQEGQERVKEAVKKWEETRRDYPGHLHQQYHQYIRDLELYDNILKVFPDIDRQAQAYLDEYVAELYFAAPVIKGECPFRVEKLVYEEYIQNTFSPQPDSKDPVSSNRPGAPSAIEMYALPRRSAACSSSISSELYPALHKDTLSTSTSSSMYPAFSEKLPSTASSSHAAMYEIDKASSKTPQTSVQTVSPLRAVGMTNVTAEKTQDNGAMIKTTEPENTSMVTKTPQRSYPILTA